MKETLSVYVVTHKKVDVTPLKLDHCYRLIRVGAYGNEPGHLLADNTGENIAVKNPYYCELTVLYWIWKNDRDSDYIGLCHYRRYFTTAALSRSPEHILNGRQIKDLLQHYDVLVARKEYSHRGVWQAYLDCGREKDLLQTEQAVRKLYPDYLDVFYKEFRDGVGNYPANMMVCSRRVLDAYCTWLFAILEEVERNTDLTGYTVQEARIYGYLSERLLGVWLAKQNLRVKELRILNTEQTCTPKEFLQDCAKAAGVEQTLKKIVFRHKRSVFQSK